MPATPAQIKAATTLDRHLAVTAGPGSGKTRVLVERYLNILEHENAGVENIVAITFTNKAANEMRERLRAEIDARVEAARRTVDEARWRERKRRLESAVITTIHGFCSRLLRENPVEAVVDPQFATLDDYTASVMLDAAAHAAVTELIDGEDELGALLVASYGRATLVGHLIAVYTTLRGLGVSLAEAERQTDSTTLGPDDYRERLAEVDRLLDTGFAIVASEVPASGRGAARRRLEALAEAWESARLTLAADPTVDGAEGFGAALRRVRASAPTKTIAASLRPWVDALRALVGERTERAGLGRIELAYYDACARPFAPILFQTLGTLDTLYSVEKRNAAALDYEDLQLRARDLVATHPAVARRVCGRYRYFLVDEFQDTNALQRDIVDLVATGEPRANLFIVGDRKQSIYGFRGAEVEVFGHAIAAIERDGGETVPLATNFRSDARLVGFFNDFFSRLMRAEPGDDPHALDALGFVAYEPGEADRPPLDDGPAVEMLLDVPSPDAEAGDEEERDDDDERPREREARRVAARIAELIEAGEPVVRDAAGVPTARRPARYGDVAMLFRAMTDVKTYERALRLAGVPYTVVAGRGFYDRPETTDLLNVLEFVDNRTDELALAAVLRSPLFGISDDTLLALRIDRLGPDDTGRRAGRSLYDALLAHSGTPYVTDDQHAALDEAASTLGLLLEIRNRVPISELLAEAIRRTDYDVVAAAADDGAQRLSNLDKLVAIARQFERGSLRLLRDFIEYVRDFRRLEAREAEAYLRSDRDAVALLTVHKAKGLEFPIVVLPDLARELMSSRGDVLFERGRGLAFKVPDGRGGLARTAAYTGAVDRLAIRERYESMRVFYVAATRAEDLLVLSGATDRRIVVDGRPLRDMPSWLHWAVAVLAEVGDPYEPNTTVVDLGTSTVRLIGPRVAIVRPAVRIAVDREPERNDDVDETDAFHAVEHVRRMLGRVAPVESASRGRYSATSLQSYANCPRQFYYARLLRLPGADPAAGRDMAERADGPARLPASMRGLVVHRFCETYLPGDDVASTLRAALAHVRTTRGDAYADVLAGLDEDAAVADLRRLADNYVASPVRRRVEERLAAGRRLPDGQYEFVRSELPFTLRTDRGFVLGTIDKLLLTPLASGRVRATIVDFKTGAVPRDGAPLAAAVERAAAEYRLQMQVYAQAVRALVPGAAQVEATLHFLHPGPGVEFDLSSDVVAEGRAARDVERVLEEIEAGGLDPVMFEARTGRRCRSCAFAAVCPEGTRSLAPAPAS